MENPFSLGAHLRKTRSAPKKNQERTWEKLGAHLRKICLPLVFLSLPLVFLSLPLIFLCLPLIFLSLPQIFLSLPLVFLSLPLISLCLPQILISLPQILLCLPQIFLSLPLSKTARQVDKIFLSDTGALEEQKCRMKTAFLHISTQPYIYIFSFITTLHTPPRNSTQ